MYTFSSYQKNIILKVFSKLQISKLRSYEGPLCEQFDSCLMVSKEDEEKLKQVAPLVKTTVIPPSVDTEYFIPRREKYERNTILWLGAFSWLPNIDSLRWFVNEIFPLIVNKYPTINLNVVGSGNIKESKLKFPSQVKFLGYIEDIRDAMSSCELAVVPLRIGSGVRVKLLELFAMGIPVVSTSLGAEGTGAIHQQHLLIADTEEDFANSVIMLLENEQLKNLLSKNARKFAIECFDFTIVGKKLEKEYLSVINTFNNRFK